MSYYAVAKGRTIGVFITWKEASKSIFKFHGAVYKKFDTKEDAEIFIKENTLAVNDVISEIPQEDDSKLIVFTDGACINNGKKNAKGSYSSIWPYHMELNNAWILSNTIYPSTNNRAEFMGLIKSYEIADILDSKRSKELHVYTDSKFIINCATLWLPKWKLNNFKKADGSSVLNQDLLVIIDNYLQKRKTKFLHVKAHTNKTDWFSKHNDIADKLAGSLLKSNYLTSLDSNKENNIKPKNIDETKL